MVIIAATVDKQVRMGLLYMTSIMMRRRADTLMHECSEHELKTDFNERE
jgi:hypothetical protein